MGSIVYTSGSLAVLERACLAGLESIEPSDISPVAVLVPGNLIGLYLRRALALREKSPGHANIRFMTLVDLARELCAADLVREGLREPDPLLETLALEQALSSAVPEKGYFAEVREKEAFSERIHSTLTDLKEAGIGPEEFSRWAESFPGPKEGGHKLKELAQIYLASRRLLRQTALVDRNDLIERAAESVAPLPFTALFIYGFYDFHPLQRRFLESLLRKKEALVFFPWREGAAFDYALPSLTWLKGLGCEHRILAEGKNQSVLERISLALFNPPNYERPRELPAETLAILSAPGEAREVQEIARECLRWVEEKGLRFTDIAILLRTPEPYAPLLAETFSRLEIPYYLHGGTPLGNSRPGRSLGLLFKVLREDFSRASVMEFITYAPIDFERLLEEEAVHAHPALWELFSIEAGIVGGPREWQERLYRLHRRREWEMKESATAEEEGGETSPSLLAGLRAFIRFLDLFFTALKALPRRGRWGGLGQSLAQLMRQLLVSSPEGRHVIEKVEGLRRCDLLEGEISLERFARAAEAALGGAEEGDNGFGKGGVFIGDLMSARGLSFKAVVVPGMVEKFFPRPWRQDPILLDYERQYISEGLKKELAKKDRAYDEEKTLFTLTLMAAQERLLLSFPRMELLTGREKIPSFFLLRLMEAATDRPANFTDLESWEVARRVSLGRLFPDEEREALDSIEYDLAEADRVVNEREPAPLRYLLTFSPFFSRSLKAEAERWGRRLFTEFDGVLKSSKARSYLRRLFPVNQTTLSPTSLESYARCPYRYFLSTLLGLAPLEEPDRFALLSPLDRGALIHEILYLFFTRLKEQRRLPLSEHELGLLETLLNEISLGALAEFEREKATGFPVLWELQKQEILEDLRGLLKKERAEAAELLPAYFEKGFTLPFEIDGGEKILFRGRIDRIDLTPEGRRARVIDYKTGQPHRLDDGGFKGGEALQLPIYLHAAASLLKEATVEEADYYYATRRGRYRKVAFTLKDWEERRSTLKEIVGGLVGGMRSGLFMARPQSCQPCPFPWICGQAAGVIYERKSLDPRIAAFEKIKEIP